MKGSSRSCPRCPYIRRLVSRDTKHLQLVAGNSLIHFKPGFIIRYGTASNLMSLCDYACSIFFGDICGDSSRLILSACPNRHLEILLTLIFTTNRLMFVQIQVLAVKLSSEYNWRVSAHVCTSIVAGSTWRMPLFANLENVYAVNYTWPVVSVKLSTYHLVMFFCHYISVHKISFNLTLTSPILTSMYVQILSYTNLQGQLTAVASCCRLSLCQWTSGKAEIGWSYQNCSSWLPFWDSLQWMLPGSSYVRNPPHKGMMAPSLLHLRKRITP